MQFVQVPGERRLGHGKTAAAQLAAQFVLAVDQRTAHQLSNRIVPINFQNSAFIASLNPLPGVVLPEEQIESAAPFQRAALA